ncbi:uncharacterized protein KY384_002546 [Bacidia gigantensis]|uniref:uncharacterized protein n=1 Tax=Bacidia gigantensis TaxID=2732470 RepID=UPI001D045481|nr:uncharacterized protein KY384_002546 [Bacidia gigantensis]KAG8532669.1 hypothetical protein KY384_002546 [Bacidia gigantensis]
MFYSETLLSKTGPLARVWLSANLERKLSKTHILGANIESSVDAIVDQGTAPMALRLSGQLLLGVVRIYSRKARYLLDDCNEALLKIKMAFRPGNVDLPANLHMPSAAALTIEDKISDPIMPDLDPSLLDFRPMDIDFNSKKDDPLNWNSQILSDPTSVEIGRHAPARDPREEFDEEAMNIDLDLDLGLDDVPTLDFGRKATPLSLDNEEMEMNDPLTDDFGFGGQTRLSSRVPSLIEDDGGKEPDNDPILFNEDDNVPALFDDPINVPNPPTNPRLQRNSQSPLSSARESVTREFEVSNIQDVEESPIRQARHKAKKRKVMQADSITMISSDDIKKQQKDRSAILKPVSFLSRDPALQNLINMQKNGGFVSSIMGDGRAKGWAPELQGILSIEAVRKSGELKRKRDSGVADVSENEPQDEDTRPQLEIPDETFGAPEQMGDAGFDVESRERSEIHLPADDGMLPGDEDAIADQRNEEDSDPGQDRFDETTAPLLHPSEQGAVSQGTKHAVHLLRDRFGSTADGSPSKQKKSHIIFQNLLPQASTSKADATKMFFEVLVLATKDAVKVEQNNQDVGSDIRIRSKRGLWGAWAETEAGGEIAEQEDDDAPPAIATAS